MSGFSKRHEHRVISCFMTLDSIYLVMDFRKATDFVRSFCMASSFWLVNIAPPADYDWFSKVTWALAVKILSMTTLKSTLASVKVMVRWISFSHMDKFSSKLSGQPLVITM